MTLELRSLSSIIRHIHGGESPQKRNIFTLFFPDVLLEESFHVPVEFLDCAVEYFFGPCPVVAEVGQVFGCDALDEDGVVPCEAVFLDQDVAYVRVVVPERGYVDVEFSLPVLYPEYHLSCFV